LIRRVGFSMLTYWSKRKCEPFIGGVAILGTMWRGFLVAGDVFAFLGGIVVVVTMAAAGGCSGGYNCTPSTIALSVGVLLTGLGFLMIFVAFGTKPTPGPSAFVPPPPPTYGAPTLPPPNAGLSGLLRTRRRSPMVLVTIALFFLGLLISLAGYLEFFAGDWFNADYATWNYPNATAGVVILAVGVLIWFSALILATVVGWREARGSLPTGPTVFYPSGYPSVGMPPGLPLPPPRPPLGSPVPAPPGSYPPGAG
jgi:hypothetical protein